MIENYVEGKGGLSGLRLGNSSIVEARIEGMIDAADAAILRR